MPKVRAFLDFLVARFSRAPWRVDEDSRHAREPAMSSSPH
jgi:hypothetical protein